MHETVVVGTVFVVLIINIRNTVVK